MTDKRALVTGGGKRLGRAMALHLARLGHDVAVHYNASSAGAEEVCAEIAALGRRAVPVQADLLNESEVSALVGRASEALGGPPNVLVNNASIFEMDTIRTATRESWDRHIGSNLRAPFVLTQQFAAQVPPAPLDHEGDPLPQAAIVNILDMRVESLTPNYASYTIAKMGLYALTTTAAQGLAPDIRVNAIAPGWTMEDPGQTHEEFLRARAAASPGRGPRPEDICQALGYLVDSPALTGQTLFIDGGQRIDWPGRQPSR